jgi:2-polyprenyl-3-methyl-5-hydroxy-6-metoxy-1,4-benzoquinol methylase
MNTHNHVYVGRDLEAMSFAINYHQWILQIFSPFIGTRIVEVGAGTGSFSEMILQKNIQSMSLVEPSTEMYKTLGERMNHIKSRVQIETYNSIFIDVADHIKSSQQPDSIVYVNVLEHIADDVAELQAVHRTLAPNGRVFIFVPALRWLLGSFDQQIGHFRRYAKKELEEKCRQVGFKILESKYLDFAGIVPWWIKYRLLKSNTMEPGLIAVYDKYFIPVAKVIESQLKLPIGKNIILIAEKL